MSFDKIKRLQEKAMFLRLLMENYAKKEDWKNRDVGDLLQQMNPLFEQIERGSVIPPMRFEYRWYFFSTESPLFAKYPSLVLAAANVSGVLEDVVQPFSEEDDRDQTSLLRERVRPFRDLLEYYAEKDGAAKELLIIMKPLLDDIHERKVTPPIVNQYRWWFTNRESPLFNKYFDLTEAASKYDSYIEDGWFIAGRGRLFGRGST